MISVILYGRNDTHGYNLHKRAAISLNCIAEVLTDPGDEIVFVDCNTPDDMPTFPEAIQDTLTPRVKGLLRILRLRPALFEKHKRGSHLPALESQSRNLAIRRTRPDNRWILSTNTDIIYVLRPPAHSLTEVVTQLPDGFYELPRFEIPETLWESFDRMNPQGILRLVGRWGQGLHLNEVTLGRPEIRYDGPGDFQLMCREQIFAIQGFDESMVLGWHVDSNLCKRLYLLNGSTGSLLDQMYGYHCDHTRQATLAHGANRVENDQWRYFENVVSPYLPEQANTWGMPDEEIDEIRLSSDHVGRFARTLEDLLPGQTVPYTEREFTHRTYNQGLYYDTEHILPFVADHLVNVPAAADISYVGGNPDLLSRLGDFRARFGHSGRLLYAADLLAQANPGRPLALPAACVAAAPETLFQRAFCFVFDAGMLSFPGVRPESGFTVRLADDAVLQYVWQFYKLFIALAQSEQEHQAADKSLPRKFLLIGSSHTWFEVPSQQLIGTTLTPHSSGVRHGYLREDAFTQPLFAPPVHTFVVNDHPQGQCAWLSQQLHRPVGETEYMAAQGRLNQLIKAAEAHKMDAFQEQLLAMGLTEVDVALLELRAMCADYDGLKSDAKVLRDFGTLYQNMLNFQHGRKGRGPLPPLPKLAPAVTRPAPAPVAPAVAQPRPAITAPFGFNVIGYLSGNLGLGSLARNIVRSLIERGYPVTILDMDPGLGRGRYDLSQAAYFAKSLADLRYAVNLFILPPPEMEHLLNATPELKGPDRLLVNVPMWELAVLPPAWVKALSQLDAVVAESQFIQTTFQAHLPQVPVLAAKPPLYLPQGIRPDRARFGLPAEAVLFVMSFEPHSDIQRKNPFAAIEAFRRGTALLPASVPAPHLVIKLNNPRFGAEEHPVVRELRALCQANPQLHLVAETLTYPDVLSLYASCDVYLSLHRAEGLGLGPMEAMVLGKPVIATGWSGNMTFMDAVNACPLSYTLVPVKGSIPAYHKDYLGVEAKWAEPSVDEAASWVARLAEDAVLRQILGRKAAEDLAQFQAEAQRADFAEVLRTLCAGHAPAPAAQPPSAVIQKATAPAGVVDVVVPVYGQADLVQRCVASVLKTEPGVHLVVVDDCSPGGEIAALFETWKNHPQITLAHTPANAGFIGTCRLGAALGQAPYILFLNSDTEALEPGWLEKLVPTDDQVAIAGVKLLYPPDLPGPLAGTLQHVGVARNAEGVPYHPFLGWPADTPQANQPHDVNAVTGACLLVRRAVWEALGGWDDGFGKGVYEDVDLCWRARQKGYRVLYQPAVCLYHRESASKAPDGRHTLNQHVQENLQRLQTKWSGLGSDEDLFFGEKTVRRWERARKQVARAQSAGRQHNAKVAATALRKALEIADDLPEVLIGYAQLLAAQADHAGATKYFEKALLAAPAAWEVRLHLTREYMAAGQLKQAAAAFVPLRQVFPEAADVKQLESLLAPYLPAARPAGPPPQTTMRAVETLQMLLAQPDLLAALRVNEDKLDTDLLALVRLSADAARAEGRLDMAPGLERLAAYIEQVLQNPPGQRPSPNRQKAAETLRLLLEAEDLPAALQRYADQLNADLLMLVRTNAQAARQAGAGNLAEGLDNLAAYIEAALARAVTPAERLETLLNADDVEAALTQHRDWLDADLLRLVQQNAAAARLAGEGGLAEGLDNLAAYITAVLTPAASPAERLETLLSADDVEASLAQHPDWLDADLLRLVRQNAAAARQEGQLDLAEGLEGLAGYIASRLGAPDVLS